MDQKLLSRRSFLHASKNAARTSCVILSLPMILTACERAKQSRLSGAEFQTLTEMEANEFDAIAARIIPSDETPGATEAGVIYFIDQVLGDRRDVELAIVREGLQDLQYRSALAFDESYFHFLETNQQDQLLKEIEAGEFFDTIRYLTVSGMFSLPQYGGNRDNIGFQLIGYEGSHAWQSPYGFYDAEYAEKGE